MAKASVPIPSIRGSVESTVYRPKVESITLERYYPGLYTQLLYVHLTADHQLAFPMKQAELNKLLNAVLRESAKAHTWKCSRGFVFKATELLFFSIIILGQVKHLHLSYSLSYKLLAFDDLFWKIVKLEENLKQPLSFRASGAWTAPMTIIAKDELSISDWGADNLQVGANEIITRCELDSEKVSKEIQGLDDNLCVIERLYTHLKDEYPNAVTDIWRERLLTSILKKEYRDSERIVRDRMNSHDFGGFQAGKKSFYELANEHLQSIL